MRILSRILVTSLVALSLIVAFVTPATGADGEPAYAFPVIDAHGPRELTDPVTDLRGRVLMLVMMNPWSDRCVEAVAHLNKLHDQHAPGGLTIVGVFEAEKDQTAGFGKRHGARFELVALSEETAHLVKKNYEYPGEPWAFLIDASGKQIATHHPQEPKFQRQIAPLLGVSSKPPILPAGFEPIQALMDDGLYAKARAKLLEKSESTQLDKTGRHWAKGVAAWIEQRRGQIFAEAEGLAGEGRYWDAWQLLDDYPRRFEGLGGEDEATARAQAIRDDEAAKKDLEGGDLIVKARTRIADGKSRQAKNICQRILRSWKGTVHADRAKALLAELD